MAAIKSAAALNAFWIEHSSVPSRAGTGSAWGRRTTALLGQLRRVAREPLLQFLLLGGLFFVVAHAVEAHRTSADRTILVDDDVVKRLSRLYEMQMGSLPTSSRIDGMVDDYVHDEVLYREAIRTGLDQNDEIIRRRLIQKLEFLNRDMAVVSEPSNNELKLYYQQHAAQFVEPGKVTFSHIYFTPDNGGDASALRRARAALEQLRRQPLPRAPQLGDRFPLQYDYAQLTHLDAAQVFGQTPIIDALFNVPAGQWSGPIQSGYGWHLIFVGGRSEDSVPPFESIRARVHDAYVEQARQDSNRKQYEALQGRYTVVRATSTQAAR